MTSLADMFFFDFSLQLYCASNNPSSPEGKGRVGNSIYFFSFATI